MEKKIIVAIDGYSSSGKSTMARRLAAATAYRYIDSGAMYRAVTLYALRNNMIVEGKVDIPALEAALADIAIDFLPCQDGQHTLLNGEDVEKQIRTLEVSNSVSPVAAIPAVRHALTAMQQKYGESRGIVMDGRDIGTTVFPDAELKVFVDASAATRARRRFDELTAKGEVVTYEQVLANVESRDLIDRTRPESPLRKADDAVVIDNSEMSIEEQDQWLMQQFNEAVAK
jgi:cytidylate kinase